MTGYVILRRSDDGRIAHSDDVRRMRQALRSQGYDATDGDILWAWRRLSDDLWNIDWYSVGRFEDAEIVHGLRKYLVPDGDPCPKGGMRG